MNLKNKSIAILCIAINLAIGNMALLMFPDLSLIYRIIISIGVIIIYGISFYRLKQNISNCTRWKLAGISILLSLSGMLIACILTSIGMRLPSDSIISAGLKGIIPMFIFAIPFASPFWIALALVNFFCLNFIRKNT